MEVIKTDRKVSKVGTVLLIDSGDEFFWCDTFILGAQHNRCTMGIIGANIETMVTLHLLKSNPYIGLDVFHQMAQVDGAIGVGQGTGNEDFTLLCGHSGCLFCTSEKAHTVAGLGFCRYC